VSHALPAFTLARRLDVVGTRRARGVPVNKVNPG
jgi:hypothetical protein